MEEPKVLIVEDRLEMAELLAISLEDDDIDTVVAETGEKALQKVRDEDVDLVLLDLGWTAWRCWSKCMMMRN